MNSQFFKCSRCRHFRRNKIDFFWRTPSFTKNKNILKSGPGIHPPFPRNHRTHTLHSQMRIMNHALFTNYMHVIRTSIHIFWRRNGRSVANIVISDAPCSQHGICWALTMLCTVDSRANVVAVARRRRIWHRSLLTNLMDAITNCVCVCATPWIRRQYSTIAHFANFVCSAVAIDEHSRIQKKKKTSCWSGVHFEMYARINCSGN